MRGSSSAFPLWSQPAAGDQVAGEQRERGADLPASPLVSTDDGAVGDTHCFGHAFLSKAELEPNALQLLPGQPAESTPSRMKATTNVYV